MRPIPVHLIPRNLQPAHLLHHSRWTDVQRLVLMRIPLWQLASRWPPAPRRLAGAYACLSYFLAGGNRVDDNVHGIYLAAMRCSEFVLKTAPFSSQVWIKLIYKSPTEAPFCVL